LRKYTEDWAARQLPEEFAEEIAHILLTYSKYNSRRKPELLSPETYSLTNYNEAERVVKEYRDLEEKAETIYEKIPEEYKDAYFQLVLFPVKASANLNELYVSAAKNNLYAKQGRASANKYADRTQELFDKDAELTEQYHTELADGKWNHMMSQTHIGYTYWQQPDQNNMPEVSNINLPEKAEMGVVAQGSEDVKTKNRSVTSLPTFDPFNDQEYYVEVFNRGQRSFQYIIQKKPSWIKVSEEKGVVEDEKRLLVKVDWEKAPKGQTRGSFRINGAGAGITIEVPINNPENSHIKGFVESNGYISMEAANFSENKKLNGSGWQLIPNLGRTGSAMASYPDEPTKQDLSESNAYLAYEFHSFSKGKAEVEFYLSPTLDFRNQGGLEFAVSVDDKEPQLINMHKQTEDNWNTSVANNVTKVKTTIDLEPGNHTLKVWAIESGVVLQKIFIKTKEDKESYLGPPESARVE
jgi:hypothetical protein